MAVPTYNMPSGNTNPAVPMAQRSTYADHPWVDPYAKFNANAASQAGNWSAQAASENPMAAGGALSSPEAFKSTFNFNYPDINNPNTASDISKWGNVLSSSNAIQAAIDKMGNSGITRAGYGGVAGAVDPGSDMRRQAIQTAASQYQGNVSQAMDYMQKRAGFNQQSAGMYLDAISKAYGITTEMAAKMMGLNLQGIGQSDASHNQYISGLAGEEGANVGDYNRWQEGDAQRQWDIKQRNQGANDAEFKRDQAAEGQNMLRSYSSHTMQSPEEYNYLRNMGPIWGAEAGLSSATGGAGSVTGSKGGGYGVEGSPTDLKRYQQSVTGRPYLWGQG